MDNQRQRIEAIDRLLIRTLKERVEVGEELARIKSDRGLDVEDEAQEQKVLGRVREYAEDQISEDCGDEIEEIWKSVMELTKNEMERHI